MTLGVSKRNLWRYVNLKINRVVHRHHVFAIISILFEEMIKDLRAGKTIKVHNFGTIQLKKMPPKKHMHIILQQMIQTPGHKAVKISVATPIAQKLSAEVELDTEKMMFKVS